MSSFVLLGEHEGDNVSKDEKDRLKPKDHTEAVAIFRSQVIGPLVCRHLKRGELAPGLRVLSEEKYHPPGLSLLRSYAVPTLQRWYYAYRNMGLSGLMPKPRSDQGYAQALTKEQRQLLLDIRAENPDVSVPTILRTIVADGRLEKDAVSDATVRRLYAEHGLDRRTLRQSSSRPRMRWEAEFPGQLWQADVCHGPSLSVNGRTVPLRIHAILDDASRYIMAIEARSTEREVDMLELMVKALRLHGAPATLYLDNGSTYSGEALATACARLEISLVHSKPYDPQSRGKIERFFRTLRGGCLDHLGKLSTLHDVQVRLLAFLDQHYHRAPHGGLIGKSPAEVLHATPRAEAHRMVTDDELRGALTIRGKRRVRRDGTVSVGGVDWEVDQSFLAGRNVTVVRTLFDPKEPPWVEHDDKHYALYLVDPKHNAKLKRKPAKKSKRGVDAIPFDPTQVFLDRALSRNTMKEDNT